ncbi:MAG TPA: ATP-binding protein [bacterium]|nr:ATP-binding protein [bacterium]
MKRARSFSGIEKRRLTKALREARSRAEQLMMSITSILIGVDLKGLICQWNRIAEFTFGLRAKEVMGKHLSECGAQWDVHPLLRGIEECRTQKQPVRMDDFFFKRSDGYEGFLGFTIIPLRTGEEITEFVFFGADITERRRSVQNKNEFVSTVSHELRTPLTIVREGMALVHDGVIGIITREQKNFLAISIQAIDRLTRIVNDLLDISKIEAGKTELQREKIDIVKLAGEVAASFRLKAESQGLRIETRFPEEGIDIFADRDKLIQVWTNLINNSLKFTAKGSVRVEVENREEDVLCRVTDTGRGIRKENLSKIFEKFQQLDRAYGPGEKGTGLGLTISKALVELHYGKIGVESQEGKGTSFFFTLPKYGAQKHFGKVIEDQIQQAARKKESLGILLFDIQVRGEDTKLLKKNMASLFHFKEKLRHSLPRHSILEESAGGCGTRALLVLIREIRKESVLMLAGKLRQIFDEETEFRKGISLTCRAAHFSEDSHDAKELIHRLFQEKEKEK